MSYESPNIVIVPTKILTNKRAQNISSSNLTPANTNAVKSLLQMSKNQDTPKPAATQSENQKPNLKTAQETVSKSKVDQIEASKNTASLEASKNVKKATVSSVSKYIHSDRKCSNTEPIKADLPSVSNDGRTNQIEHHTWKNKCKEKITINLLPRPTVPNPNGGPMCNTNTPNFSVGANPMNTKWTLPCPSEFPKNPWTNPHPLNTPTNLSTDYGHYVGTTFTSSSLLQNPTIINTDFTIPWTYPSLLETTSHLNIGSTPYAKCPCTPQMQTFTNSNADSRSFTDTTLTYPSQLQADTFQGINCYPCMDTTTICPPAIPITPNYTTDFTTHIDTTTWQIQDSHENTINRPIDTYYNNSTGTLVRQQEITSSRTAFRGTSSPSFKSRMDYTWLTRAHYANINQPNKKSSIDKPVVSVSKNKEKQTVKTATTSVAKEQILLSGRGNKLRSNSSNSKIFSNEKQIRTDAYTKNNSSIKDSASSNKCKEEEMREKERKRNKIKEEIKILETTIKNINSNKKLLKYTYSTKKSVGGSHKAETTPQTKQVKNKTKDILSDKNENGNKYTSQKCKPSRELNFKKRIRYNSEDSEPEQKRSRRSNSTNISTQHKRENKKHSNDTERKNVDVGHLDEIRSKSVKTHSSEKLPRKRKGRDSSYESIPKKRFLHESENIHSIANNNDLKSLVTPVKLSVKHPRVRAPESSDSNDSTEPDFDLRSKLSRKSYRNYARDKMSNVAQIISEPEKPRENLLITVYPNDNSLHDEKTTTAASTTKPSDSKQKTKKYKKLRLVINVIQEDTSDDTSSSEVSKGKSSTSIIDKNLANWKPDLSFLDEINIDEIVNSLKTYPESLNVNQQQKVENTNVDPQIPPIPEPITNTFVQPIIIKKETTAHIDSQIQPDPKSKSSAELITKPFVQPIIIKKEIITDSNIIAPQIQSEQKAEKAKTLPIANKFVQPIIIKKEIFEEYLDPQTPLQQSTQDTKSSNECMDSKIQPYFINSGENDNVKISMHLNNNPLKQNSDNIINAVGQTEKDGLLQNIKQEMHEDQTEIIDTDDSSTDTLYLHTSLDQDDLETIDQLSDTAVENVQSVNNNSRMKLEPCNSYDVNFFEQGEPQNLLSADKNISTYVSSKEWKKIELSKISESGEMFDESNRGINEIFQIDNNNVVLSDTEKSVNIKKLSVIETIHLADQDKENKSENRNNLAKSNNVFKENREAAMMRIINGPMDINKTESNLSIEKSYQQHKQKNNRLVTYSTSIKDSYKLKNDAEDDIAVDTTTSEQGINLTERTILSKGDKLEFVDKEINISNKFKTVNVVDATETLQLLQKQATDSKPIVNTVTDNYDAIKTVNVEDPTETFTLKKQALESKPVVIIEKINCGGFKTVKLDADGKFKLEAQALENKTVFAIKKNKSDEINTVNVQDATETLKEHSEDKPATNVLIRHGITYSKYKASTENTELSDNANADTKLETIKQNSDVVRTSNEIAIKSLQVKQDQNKIMKLKDTEQSNENAFKSLQVKEDPNKMIKLKDTEQSNETAIKSLQAKDPKKMIKLKVTEQTPHNELATTTSVIRTETNNKEPLGKIEHQNNANADPRTATVTYPEQNSNKDLVVKIKDRLLYRMKQKFDVVSKLHSGKFSKVFMCKDTNNKEYVLKILHDKYDCKRFGVEKQEMLHMLQNEIQRENYNIVYLINGFSLERTWCFLLEHYPLTLGWALKTTVLYMDTVQELAKQLVAAVLVIRSYNIVHSDIKPGHILLNSSHTKLKVCGFDAAYYVDEKKVILPNIGTTQYRAPEVILGHSAGYSIDVWASAVVLYEMATGSKLFPTIYNNDTLFKQMCLCGRMPMNMMLSSRFSHKHFNGTVFKRVIGPRGEHEQYYTHNLHAKNRIYNLLMETNTMQRWPKCMPFSKRVKETAKLSQMSRLLDKMLVLDPNQRLPIEYVFSDPFFMYKRR